MLFPKLAELLQISIDDLFGYSIPEQEQYVSDVMQAVDEACRAGKLVCAEKLCRTALRKYPHEYGIQLKLAIILKTRFLLTQDNQERVLEESIQLSKHILKNSPSLSEKHTASKNLAIAYDYLGDSYHARKTAEQIVRDLDPVELYIRHGKEKITACKTDIAEYLEMIRKRLKIISKVYSAMGNPELSREYAEAEVHLDIDPSE